MRNQRPTLAVLLLAAGCASVPETAPAGSLQEQVMQTERAFARTMAERDHAAFSAYLADEAVFFSGERPLRGKQVIAAEWRPFFDGATAPFSWEPDQVQVLDSGSLALSTGPVRDPSGRIVGRFTSIWRREAPGRWRIVFDKGSPVCDDRPAESP